MERRKILALAMGFFIPIAASASPQFTRVALTGEAAPGAGDLRFGQMDIPDIAPPQINNHGQILFTAGVAGDGADAYGPGMWMGTPGNLAPVAHTGSITRNALRIGYISGGVLNDDGQIALYCYVTAGPYNGHAILTGTPGYLISMAREFVPAPGTGFSYYQLTFPQINNKNDVAVYNFHQTFENLQPLETSVFRGSPLNTRVVAYQGQAAPDALSGLPFTLISTPWLTESGAIYFLGSISSSRQFDGIFPGSGGAITPIVIFNQSAPGFPNDAFLRIRDGTHVDDASDLIFTAVHQSGALAVWKYSPRSGLQELLHSGDPVPGMPGSTWRDFGQTRLTSDGLIEIEGNTGQVKGCWGETPDNLHLLIQTGGHAPGAPAGVNFVGNRNIQDLNEAGVFLHAGSLSNGKKGVWAADLRSGEVIKVLLTGDLFDVGGGDMRTLVDFGVANDSALNNFNQFAFSATFSDGSSGEFIATVPEPGTPLLLMAGWLLIGGKQRGGQRVWKLNAHRS